MSPENSHGGGPTFDYTVDGDARRTSEHRLTPRQILVEAGFNPEERYLVQLRGNQQESYQNSMNDPIQMHEHMKFITVFFGPVPVS